MEEEEEVIKKLAFADIESITVFRSRSHGSHGFLVAINFKRFFREVFGRVLFFFSFSRELCEVHVRLKN